MPYPSRRAKRKFSISVQCHFETISLDDLFQKQKWLSTLVRIEVGFSSMHAKFFLSNPVAESFPSAAWLVVIRLTARVSGKLGLPQKAEFSHFQLFLTKYVICLSNLIERKIRSSWGKPASILECSCEREGVSFIFFIYMLWRCFKETSPSAHASPLGRKLGFSQRKSISSPERCPKGAPLRGLTIQKTRVPPFPARNLISHTNWSYFLWIRKVSWCYLNG